MRMIVHSLSREGAPETTVYDVGSSDTPASTARGRFEQEYPGRQITRIDIKED